MTGQTAVIVGFSPNFEKASQKEILQIAVILRIQVLSFLRNNDRKWSYKQSMWLVFVKLFALHLMYEKCFINKVCFALNNVRRAPPDR